MRHRLYGNDRGQVLVWTSLLIVILLGFLALAMDGGFLYQHKRQMQTAADSAALAGAHEVKRDDTLTQTGLETAARHDASLNGFTHGSDGIDVDINRPPESGPFIGRSSYVEAIITHPHRTFFARVLNLLGLGNNFNTATVRARAVAGPLKAPQCIYAMNPTIGRALWLEGTPDLIAPDCGVYVGSNAANAMHLQGEAAIDVAAINIVGNYTCEGQSCNNIDPDPDTGSATQSDPFASLTPPTPQGSCLSSPASGSGPATLYPGRYCTGIKIEGIPSARFEPGVYYVENGFRITSTPVVTGTGVFFYIASGQLKIDGGANVSFSASTSGDYKGIVFFQSRTNTTDVVLTGGTGMNINGAVYALGAKLDYAGGNCTTSPPKTMIVADTIHFVGHSCIGRPDDMFLASSSQVVLAE